MRTKLPTTLAATLAVLVVAPACDKADNKPASEAKPNAPAKPVEEPAAIEATAAPADPEPPSDTAGVEPTPPDDSTAVAPSATPVAGAGFSVGAPANIADDGTKVGEVEVGEPLANGGVRVIVRQGYETDGEDTSIWHLHTRVEFDGVDAAAQLNHQRATKVEFAERVFVSAREIAKLPDGRWLVDTALSGAAGEDSISSDTDHSVVLIDPAKRTAAVVWTGVDSSLSDGGGACETDLHHEFKLVDDTLVVTKVSSTVGDAEIMEELGWSAEECEVKPKARAELARVPLATP